MPADALLALVLTTSATVASGGFVVDQASLAVTPVVLMKAGTPVSLGTGFYYSRDESSGRTIVFLVTNHHVFAGYPPQEKKAPLGDSIAIFCHRDPRNPSDIESLTLPLYAPSGVPLWINSAKDPIADVAALPIPERVGGGCKFVTLGKRAAEGQLLLRPTSSVSLVGYPFGLSDQANKLPIWKTGAIASEPEYEFDGQPTILVDVSAYPGMSGSPVFAVAQGAYEAAPNVTVPGGIRLFIGVFSALKTRDELRIIQELQAQPGNSRRKLGVALTQSLELGLIWKASVVIEMLEAFDAQAWARRVR